MALPSWPQGVGDHAKQLRGWLRRGPGPEPEEAHVGHDLELAHVDQLGGQQLPKRFLLVAKLSAHLLGRGQCWFSWGMMARTAAAPVKCY